jgi:hypothetical protein
MNPYLRRFMFTSKPQTETPELDEAITTALRQLEVVPAYSDEYIKIVSQIEKLYALKNQNRSQRVSPDTMAIIIGNLLGIVFILEYEHAHVVTSKALNFVLRASR